jgi:hypothetical protein
MFSSTVRKAAETVGEAAPVNPAELVTLAELAGEGFGWDGQLWITQSRLACDRQGRYNSATSHPSRVHRAPADGTPEHDRDRDHRCRGVRLPLPPLGDSQSVTRTVLDAVAGFGPLQAHPSIPPVSNRCSDASGRRR